jgi:hypothetical protein
MIIINIYATEEHILSLKKCNPVGLLSQNISHCKPTLYQLELNKGNIKITELRTILQRESQNS